MFPRRWLPIIPVLIFVVLAVFFVRRLQMIEQGKAPGIIPSVMINRPAPDFVLPNLVEGEKNLTLASLKGQVVLINIFASWCLPCRVEHPYLDQIKKAGIRLVGMNYKDKPDAARAWIAKMGNPYGQIGEDQNGRVAIDFGAYGVPESYLLDKQGIIRFKQVGPLTPEIIQGQLLPLAKELSQ